MLGLSETSVSTNSVAWTLNVGTLLGGEANICVYIHMYIYIFIHTYSQRYSRVFQSFPFI